MPILSQDELVQLMVANLEDGTKEIRFGDHLRPYGMMDALVIRRIRTPAGIQYCVRETSYRGEGSGIYDHGAVEIAKWARRIAERYMKPHQSVVVQKVIAEARGLNEPSFYVTECNT